MIATLNWHTNNHTCVYPRSHSLHLQIMQMILLDFRTCENNGPLRGYLFRAYIKGVSQHYLYLAETQKQRQKDNGFIAEDMDGSGVL